jgi:hypothetical protein
VATGGGRQRLVESAFVGVGWLFLTRVFGTVVKEEIAGVMVFQNPKAPTVLMVLSGRKLKDALGNRGFPHSGQGRFGQLGIPLSRLLRLRATWGFFHSDGGCAG